MEAREINLAAYDIPGARDPEGGPIPFDMREFVYDVLLNPLLGLTAVQVMEHGELARRVRDHAGDSILLDRVDYDRLKWSIDAVGGDDGRGGRRPGFMAAAEEAVRRVLNAPKVEVDSAKPGP